jgi:hypothetical protein
MRNETIFVGSSTDIFGDWIPSDIIIKILNTIIKYIHSSNTVIFLTKNAKRYLEFKKYFQKNWILGVTIETNQQLEGYSTLAQTIQERLEFFWNNEIHENIMVSIEPILKFNSSFPKDLLKFKILPKWIILGFNSSKIKMHYPTKQEMDEFYEDLIEAFMDSDTVIMVKPNLALKYDYDQYCYPIKAIT